MRIHLIKAYVLAFSLVSAMPASSAQNDTAEIELAKPFDWPVIVAKTPGLEFSLRTALQEGVLKYVATINDGKGRVARYLSKPRGGSVATSSFQVKFSDEAGFLLYTLYILDHTLSKIDDTSTFESTAESRCTEKFYRTLLKASNIAFTYPTELTKPNPPSK